MIWILIIETQCQKNSSFCMLLCELPVFIEIMTIRKVMIWTSKPMSFNKIKYEYECSLGHLCSHNFTS